jgi:hypothetical protein
VPRLTLPPSNASFTYHELAIRALLQKRADASVYYDGRNP